MKNNRHKKKIKRRDYSNKPSKTQRVFATLMMIIFGSLFIGIPFLNEYIQAQILIKLKPEILMVLVTSVFFITLPFSFIAMIVSMIFCEFFRYEKFVLRKHQMRLIAMITLLLFCITIPFAFVYNRYEISEVGILKYSILNSVQKQYSWNDISKVDVYVAYISHYRVGGDYYLNYDIELNDGKHLYLASEGHAREFWNSLYRIDSILKNNNVPIIRKTKDIEKLEGDYRKKVEGLIY